MNKTLVAIAVCIALLPIAAYADTTTTTTTVSLPFGDWLGALVAPLENLLTLVIGALVAWIMTKIPASIKAFITAQNIAQAEQLLENAIGYGINTVAGAEKGKTLEINVGNAVAAQAAQYAVDHGPAWLISWMGGPDQILEKIIARLPLVSGGAPVPSTASSGIAQ